MNLTIDITFIAIWIAQWNRFLFRLIDNKALVIIALRHIEAIDADIKRMQVDGKTPKFISFEFVTKI